jgi:hypothetical protein
MSETALPTRPDTTQLSLLSDKSWEFNFFKASDFENKDRTRVLLIAVQK